MGTPKLRVMVLIIGRATVGGQGLEYAPSVHPPSPALRVWRVVANAAPWLEEFRTCRLLRCHFDILIVLNCRPLKSESESPSVMSDSVTP